MDRSPLPLDDARYAAYLSALRSIIEHDPDLGDVQALRAFIGEHQEWFGPRTAAVTAQAPESNLRALVHVMVLAASELHDLHERSRLCLETSRHPLPPWDVTVPRVAQRWITFNGKVCGMVSYGDSGGVTIAPQLSGAERRWVTALAVGMGACPQWDDDHVARYAAYLLMGTEEFAGLRTRTDEELAREYDVPLETVRKRRELPDRV